MTILTTKQVRERLHAKYGKDGSHAIFFEVPDGTGSDKCRTADAIIMSLWPSRGLDITGLEIKVSRGDWLKELKTPEKSLFFWQQCDYWGLCAGDASIVRTGELPKGWGLMQPYGDGLRWKVLPERLERPVVMSRNFIAGLCRAAFKYEPPDAREVRLSIQRAEKESFAAGYREGKEGCSRELKNFQAEHQNLLQCVREFESATGFKIADRWQNPVADVRQIMAAIRVLRTESLGSLLKAVQVADSQLESVQQLFRKADNDDDRQNDS